MAMKSQGIGTRRPAPAGVRSVMVWQVLSALLLLVMAGIHLYLVTDGVGGTLGKLFVLNVIGGVVLAVAMVVLKGRMLLLASVAGLLFMAGTLLALILALTVGFFTITEVWSFTLVPETVVVESIGTVVLAVTTYLLYQPLRGSLGRL
ncbi:MAG TPA: hypothetical protein VLM05_05530 [Mycobacteriales bacterium]|nr:hypothetical protein [Mycobacteriales bacterium]